MAEKNRSGENIIPRYVVKIIGSKQVKQYIEEPQRESGVLRNAEQNPTFDENCKTLPEKQNKMLTKSDRLTQRKVDSALWAVIDQVPDRLCVTAPSGDRSRSYIHPKIQHDSKGAAEDLETTEQKGTFEDRGQAELSLAVRDELCDWQLSALRSVEEEATTLDLTFCGTLNQSNITHLFLKHDVPLKLPTLSLLLKTFSDKHDPVQIDYRSLFQFITSSAFLEQPCDRFSGAEQGQS